MRKEQQIETSLPSVRAKCITVLTDDYEKSSVKMRSFLDLKKVDFSMEHLVGTSGISVCYWIDGVITSINMISMEGKPFLEVVDVIAHEHSHAIDDICLKHGIVPCTELRACWTEYLMKSVTSQMKKKWLK